MQTTTQPKHSMGNRTRARAAGREFLGGLPTGLWLERGSGWYYLVKGDYELAVHTRDLVVLQWLIGQEIPGAKTVD